MLATIVKVVAFLGLLPGAGCGPAPMAAVTELEESPAESKRVLVVINKSSPDSIAIGAYYVQKRQIPKANVVMIECRTSDTISVDEYRAKVEPQVKEGIKACKNTIDFIVTTRGVPIRLRDEAGWSLDGHLGAMNLGLTPMSGLNEQNADAQISKSLNPYFQSKDHFSSAKFKGMYLVCRLDGYTVADAKRLVDNSLAAKPDKGPFFFNGAVGRDGGGYGEMQKALINADKNLKAQGFETSYEEKKFRNPGYPLMGYASWGSNDGTFSLEEYKKLRFKPGAVVETYVSTSARTFNPTSGGQSLIADLIAQGVTGVKGYVSEPYTFALANPEILFNRYTNGFNLAESFYAASLLASWKDLVIGDPLCNPYAK